MVRSWDDYEGEIPPKSPSSVRDVPILKPLGVELAAHALRCEWTSGLVFGASATVPFAKSSTIYDHTRAAWEAANEDREPGEQLAPISLHEGRHTTASLFIAAGANIKTVQVVMGHSSITETLDRYSHLLPGGLEEAATKVDAFLSGAGVV